MLVEAQIVAGEHFGQKNDLPGVMREVLHHMRDRFQHRHVVALRQDALSQSAGGYFTDDAGCLRHGRFQKLRQFRGRFLAARVKFRIALPMVRQATDTRADPLPNIPAEVQHQIADCVFVFRITGPDLLGREARQAILNSAVKLFQLLGRKRQKYFVGRYKAPFTRLLQTNSRESISPSR